MLHDLSTLADQGRKETVKPSDFEPWVQSNFSLKGTQMDRVVSILRTSFWSRLWATYVQTAYGQKVFNFTLQLHHSRRDLQYKTRVCMNWPIFLLMLLNDTRLMYRFYSFGNKKLAASLTGGTLRLAMHTQRQSIERHWCKSLAKEISQTFSGVFFPLEAGSRRRHFERCPAPQWKVVYWVGYSLVSIYHDLIYYQQLGRQRLQYASFSGNKSVGK
jgi:hypothetical protein